MPYKLFWTVCILSLPSVSPFQNARAVLKRRFDFYLPSLQNEFIEKELPYLKHEENSSVIEATLFPEENPESIIVVSHEDDNVAFKLLSSHFHNYTENLEIGANALAQNILDMIFGPASRKKIWTKMDYKHIHATTGVIFMGGGFLWLLFAMTSFASLTAHGPTSAVDDVLQKQFKSNVVFFISIAGIMNGFSAIPMSNFKNKEKTYDFTDLKRNGFIFGGTGLTCMCLWMSWWFSGDYPDCLDSMTPVVVFFWCLLCILTTFNWEMMLHVNVEGQNGLRKSKTKRVEHKELLYRLASWPNLTQIIFMSNIGVGGNSWLTGVLERFPAQRAPLFHYSFASALTYAFSMLFETLRDRKLVSLQQDLMALIFSIMFPMVVVAVDVLVSKSDATLDPFQYWICFT